MNTLSKVLGSLAVIALCIAGKSLRTNAQTIYINGGVNELNVQITYRSLDDARLYWRRTFNVSGPVGTVICPITSPGEYTVCDLPEVRAVARIRRANAARPEVIFNRGDFFRRGVFGSGGTIINVPDGRIIELPGQETYYEFEQR